MSLVKCSCGETYDVSEQFCPNCEAKNPKYRTQQSSGTSSFRKKASKSNLQNNITSQSQGKTIDVETVIKNTINESQPINISNKPKNNDSDSISKKNSSESIKYDNETQAEKEYTKPSIPKKQKSSPLPVIEEDDDEDEYYEDEFEDDEDEEFDDNNNYDENLEEDEEHYEDEFEDDEDEEDDDEDYIEPPVKRMNHSINSSTRPKGKTVKDITIQRSNYNPNHDGYYDDRLPAIVDEITKTTHIDMILKIALSIVGIIALIVYCIFYLQF